MYATHLGDSHLKFMWMTVCVHCV